MVNQQFLLQQYGRTYEQIKESTSGITQAESLREIEPGINCLNWLVGHIVVARTNFLMFLDVPSIWGWEDIKHFIPGSTPILNEAEAYPFAQLLADLGQTQEQLQIALERMPQDVLGQVRDEKSIVEHLVFYAAHEAEHTGQVELICLLLKNERA